MAQVKSDGTGIKLSEEETQELFDHLYKNQIISKPVDVTNPESLNYAKEELSTSLTLGSLFGGPSEENKKEKSKVKGLKMKALMQIAPMIFRNHSEDYLARKIYLVIGRTKLSFILEWIPNLPRFIARLFKDKIALPQMALIVGQPGKLILYFIIFVFTLVAGSVWKKFHLMKRRGVLFTFIKGTFRSIVLLGLRLFTFYFLFSKELDPSLRVFKSVFL